MHRCEVTGPCRPGLITQRTVLPSETAGFCSNQGHFKNWFPGCRFGSAGGYNWGMYATDTILTFSFPLGRLGGARLRMSFLFPVTAVAIIWRFRSIENGLLATAVIVASVLLHELAHLVVSRSTGGEMDNLCLWPLGGLEEPYGRGYWQDHVQTMMAGPFANLLVALSCLLTVPVDQALQILNPTTSFVIAEGESLVSVLTRMAFLINVTLFAINLLPITPFDGGVLLRTYLSSRFSEVEGRDLIVRLGLICALFGMITGFVLNCASVVAVSAFILVFHLHENMKWYESTQPNDSIAEFDLTEDSDDLYGESGEDELSETDRAISQQEVLERWRMQREHERVREERAQVERDTELMDKLLAKLHRNGRDSLTADELTLLTQLSNQIRDRRQHN